MTPIVVTGLGLTTGLGIGVDVNWEALRAGRSGLRPLTSIDTSEVEVKLGAEAPPLPGLREASDGRDRAHAYLRGVCQEALASAGIVGRVPAPERAALFLGSSLAAQASCPAFWESALERGAKDADYQALRSYDAELRLADLCAAFGVRGESLLVSNACAAGASAVAAAADVLRLGRADLALVAGYDALDLHTFSGFGGIKALTPTAVRPFSKDRAGMLLGDGYAALLLEGADHARAAGRTPLGRLAGYGESADAFHLTQPHPQGEGAALAMRRALACAGLEPDAIDAVNVHCTATPTNDRAEYRGMLAVFGERLARLPLVASKPAVGHTLGGAGAVEAVISLLALRAQCLPPTLCVGEPDPALGPLDVVTEARPGPLVHVMSNSFGFGGCNASLIFSSAP